MAGEYKIIESQLPLVGGLAGHNFIAVLAPNGAVIREYNGLATSADGHIKPIGYFPSDQLKVYADNGARFYDGSQHQQTLFSTSNIGELNARISALDQCMNLMNGQNMSYPFLGLGKNSNSVATTLISCIGVTETNVPDGAWIMPGVGDKLLTQPLIDAVRTNNGIFSKAGAGFDTGSMFDNSWSTPNFGDLYGNFN